MPVRRYALKRSSLTNWYAGGGADADRAPAETSTCDTSPGAVSCGAWSGAPTGTTYPRGPLAIRK